MPEQKDNGRIRKLSFKKIDVPNKNIDNGKVIYFNK
jgi:hypothetical protein